VISKKDGNVIGQRANRARGEIDIPKRNLWEMPLLKLKKKGPIVEFRYGKPVKTDDTKLGKREIGVSYGAAELAL